LLLGDCLAENVVRDFSDILFDHCKKFI